MKKFGKAIVLALCLCLCAFAFAACGDEKPTSYDGTWVRTAEDGFYYLVIEDDKMTVYFAAEDDFSKATALRDGTFKLTSRTEESVTAVNEAAGYTKVYTVTTDGNSPALKLEDEKLTYDKR